MKRRCFEFILFLNHTSHFIKKYIYLIFRIYFFSFTSGYGNIAPRTTLGRIVTMVYAIFGIPLTLIYLSSTGGVLARVARGIFSR